MRPLMPPVQTPDNLFHDGNPLTGELGTIVDAEHLNNEQAAIRDTQSELIAILTAAAMEPASTAGQLLAALNKLYAPLNDTLGALSTLVGGANKLPYFTAANAAALTALSSTGRDIIGKATVADVLTYLGLGEAKYVTSRGSNANGVWTIWSDGAIELYGHTPSITDGLAIVTFPIALPKVIRHFTMAERLSGDSGSSVQQLHVSMIIDNTVTTSGFKARCQMATGAPSSNGFSWRAYCPPN